MNGAILMVLIFVLIVSIAVGLMWYNSKYNKKIDIGTAIIVIFVLIGVAFFVLIKNMATNEKQSIVKIKVITFIP